MQQTREVAVSLQGTFDVFSLPELLRMLAGSAKTGGLVVEASGAGGRIDLHGGACVGVENAEQRSAPTTVDELHARLVDICFAIVREPTGGFRFTAVDGAPEPEFSVPFEPVLAEVDLLAAEWRDLTARIPSLDLRPELVEALPGDAITLTASEWACLARCDGVRSVRDLAGSGQRALVEICRVVADLVDRGALQLVERTGSAEHAERPDSERSNDPLDRHDLGFHGGRVEPVAPYGPGVDAPARGSRWRNNGSGGDPESAVALADAEAADAPAADAPAADLPPPPPPPAPVPVEAAAPVVVDVGSTGESDDPGVAAAVSTPYGELDEHDSRDRGAILKLFSALREA